MIATQEIERLASLMARLRDPEHGCAWDRAQNFATIAPYTIEEAYEVAQAIADGDMAALRDELGDLLLQVVFHARIAEELGAFDLAAVARGIVDKMERRHPHIFGNAGASRSDEVAATWEAIKAGERSGRGELAGVALALPALMRAQKLQARAARVGFDWPDATGPRAKVAEELVELDAAGSDDARADEVGDLLFSVVNLARHMKIDPEVALRAANRKFARRFAMMEAAAGDGFAGLDLDAKERLWAAAKATDG